MLACRPMFDRAKDVYTKTLSEIRDAGLYKDERIITTPQGAQISVGARDASSVLNFCANNYLGLSSHPKVIEAAHRVIDTHGFGMSSVRFICGTQDIHKELEKKISAFFGTEDTILYGSCFDANGGLFETLLGEEDAIISDALNHAVDHRRHPSLQGRAPPLPERRHGRAREGARGDAGEAPPDDRDRRRLLDGRLPREAG